MISKKLQNIEKKIAKAFLSLFIQWNKKMNIKAPLNMFLATFMTVSDINVHCARCTFCLGVDTAYWTSNIGLEYFFHKYTFAHILELFITLLAWCTASFTFMVGEALTISRLMNTSDFWCFQSDFLTIYCRYRLHLEFIWIFSSILNFYSYFLIRTTMTS